MGKQYVYITTNKSGWDNYNNRIDKVLSNQREKPFTVIQAAGKAQQHTVMTLN